MTQWDEDRKIIEAVAALREPLWRSDHNTRSDEELRSYVEPVLRPALERIAELEAALTRIANPQPPVERRGLYLHEVSRQEVARRALLSQDKPNG